MGKGLLIYEISEKNSQYYFKGNCYVSSGWTKTNMTKNECGHSLLSITLDHHLHHEWQWLATITSHWLYQLPIVSVDSHRTICSQLWAKNSTKVCLLHFSYISTTVRLSCDLG
jgi:hypothetical protein